MKISIQGMWVMVFVATLLSPLLIYVSSIEVIIGEIIGMFSLAIVLTIFEKFGGKNL